MTDPRSMQSFFQLAHQVLARETRGALLAVSVRGFGSTSSEPGLDIVLSTGRELASRSEIPEAVARLERDLRLLGAEVGYFDGSRRTVAFAGGKTAQWNYSDTHYPGSFVYLYLSSEFREAFRSRFDEEDDERLFAAVGIERRRGNLLYYVASLLGERRRAGTLGEQARIPQDDPRLALVAEAIELCRRFERSANVIHLAGAKERADAAGARLLRFLDVASNRTYLVLVPAPGHTEILFLLDLRPGRREELRLTLDSPDLQARIADFLSKVGEAVLVTEPLEGAR